MSSASGGGPYGGGAGAGPGKSRPNIAAKGIVGGHSAKHPSAGPHKNTSGSGTSPNPSRKAVQNKKGPQQTSTANPGNGKTGQQQNPTQKATKLDSQQTSCPQKGAKSDSHQSNPAQKGAGKSDSQTSRPAQKTAKPDPPKSASQGKDKSKTPEVVAKRPPVETKPKLTKTEAIKDDVNKNKDVVKKDSKHNTTDNSASEKSVLNKTSSKSDLHDLNPDVASGSNQPSKTVILNNNQDASADSKRDSDSPQVDGAPSEKSPTEDASEPTREKPDQDGDNTSKDSLTLADNRSASSTDHTDVDKATKSEESESRDSGVVPSATTSRTTLSDNSTSRSDSAISKTRAKSADRNSTNSEEVKTKPVYKQQNSNDSQIKPQSSIDSQTKPKNNDLHNKTSNKPPVNTESQSKPPYKPQASNDSSKSEHKWAAKTDKSSDAQSAASNVVKSTPPKSAPPSSVKPANSLREANKTASQSDTSIAKLDSEQKLSKSSSTPKLSTLESDQKPLPPKSAPPGRQSDHKSSASQQNGAKPETPSGSSGHGSGSSGSSNRLLILAQKNEWQVLDQVLRAMDKNVPQPSVNVADHETGVTPLMLAVRENRLVISERLLDLGANVNDRAKDGRTALHFAAAYSKDDMIKLLINRRAEPFVHGGPKNQLPLHMACARSSGVLTIVQQLIRGCSKDSRLAADKDGDIPLFLAAESGNTTVCRELLQHAAEQQVQRQRKGTKDTVLHLSCRRKDFDMSRLFVDNHAKVDAQNVDGHSPLHVCAWEGDDGMVKFLHQHKANANIVDNMDRTPLHIAAERGHTAIVEVLVDKLRANVAARTKDGSTLMHIASQYGHPDTALAFLKKGVPMHMPNKSGALCLHAAAKKGHVNVMKALLQKGAHVDAKTKDGYTALHIAVEYCKPLAVQTLLGFGAQVELKGGTAKETPLHIASRVKDGEKCAEMLIKSGADVNAAQENGETALHIASRHGLLKMVQALLAEGADPTWQSKSGENPMHVCARYCHWEVADELLNFITKSKSRIDAVMLVNHQNVEGETPSHYAAELTKKHAHHEFEDTDMIKLLLEYDADINIHTKLTQETSLHYCARAGNADIMLEMVQHIGPSRTQLAVNKQAKNGWSPLLVASEHGHLEIVKILLKHNARVDVFDEHGKAALHLAGENGHEGVADVLLWHRAFVNAKSKLGVTPLHLASESGYNKLVKLLIETHGAATDALSLAKKTPLHMAAQNGQMEVCNTLLKMKADANATDVHGQTPLHLAAENDHSDVVKLFLKHRPELVTMANTNGMTCAHIAASKGSVAVVKELMRFNKTVVTTARNKTNDSTTLHLAAAGGHAEVVKVLLEAGASATDENADGMTAIHLAGRFGHTGVLDALKERVSWKVTSTKTGFTALHVAAHYGQIDFVREMLSKVPATTRSEAPHATESGSRESGSEYGFTPLHLAAQSGHEGLVRLLLNSPGVQADSPTAVNGSIPLHLAAQSGHTSVVSLLLSKSTAQLHVKDKRGRTGLHLAASNGHLDMVALLLGQGADIDVYDKNGWTALHFASKAGHLNVVKLLMEAGANPKYETKDGKVPICFAAAQNHAEVLSYLMKKEHDTHVLMDDKKFGFDLMVVGKQNLNQSIEEFVLQSNAPVDTAVKLSRQFRLLAIKEKERARDLVSAGDYCEAMATELNAIASSINNAGVLLKSVDIRGIPFLDVLIECEQKEVVSHPSVQKYLSEVWMGHLSHWQGWKMIMLFVVMLIVPPVWLAFCLPFKHRFNKVPVIKFMSYLVSHIYLIVLFILTVVVPLVPISWSGDLVPQWYEWLLLAWLSGLIVSQLTNPEDRAGLGWIKVIIIGVSVVGVCVHVIAFAFPYSVKPEDATAGYNNQRLECLYIRNQFFGFALMLCFVQMMDFLSFHHLFGPWAIIIRDLMKDLIRFLVILSIFMIGFTLNLTAVYQPVYDSPPLDENKGNGTGGGGTVTESPFETFEMLFFALFGLVEPENLPPVHRNPVWSLNLVKAVFGVYLLVTLIVLINLLIAMMSDTYQRIQAQSDTEWKFGRAKLFRNMNKTSATPSPLNLATKLYVYCKVLFKHKGKVCSMNAQHFVDKEEDLDTHADSRSLEALSSGGHSAWLRNMVRRNTQISPDGDFLHTGNMELGPVCIEDVVNWRQVADKYLALRGRSDSTMETARIDDIDTVENISETKANGEVSP